MTKPGLVIKSTGSWYDVLNEENEIVRCRIKGKFRTKGIKTTNPIAVGDKVDFEPDGDEGVINKIYDRKNYIIRKSINLSKRSHILASNLDQALLLVTIERPFTSFGFIDRFLVTAEAYHIPVTIVFNKIDQYNQEELEELEYYKAVYKMAGYETIDVSAKNGFQIDKVKSLLKDKTTLLSGHSGVGKSTLINAIDKRLNLKTSSVSTSHNKGKHTTTFAEMFMLQMGGKIIDTPGVKGFGLIDMSKEHLSHYFPEMRIRLSECKFNNCMHLNEPGCAIKLAVEENEIPISRMESYLSMLEEDEEASYR